MATKPGNQTIIPTLHHLESSQSLRVLWMLEELAAHNGTQYKFKIYPRQFKNAELEEIFPLGKSPVLTLESDDPTALAKAPCPIKPNTMAESRIIVQWIADTYGDGLFTPDEEDKMRNEYFDVFGHGSLLQKADFALIHEIVPAMMPFPIKQLLGFFNSFIVNHFKNDLNTMFTLMEGQLSEEKPWFSGKKLGVADINASFAMDMCVQRGYFDKKRFPRVGKWYDTVQNRDAYKRALEKGGKYDLTKFT